MLSALNISKEEVESVIFLPSDTALISIGEEHEPFWKLKVTGDNILLAVFSDVERAVVRGGRQYNPIDMVTADAMVNFISQHHDKKFIVNCRAGVSRSAAVALFIHRQYGHSLKPNFWHLSHPNSLVFRCLTHAQQKLSK